MKKFILKLDLHDDKDKRKALKTVSALSGIDSITMNMKEKKLTVVGTVDPISVISKLRKFWPTDIVSVGPAKEPEKKEEPKKEEAAGNKKEDAKKEEPKKEEASGKKEAAAPKDDERKKKEEGKKEEEKKSAPPEAVVGMRMPYRPYTYHPPINTYYNYLQPHHHSIEENPNACVIC